MNRKLGASAGAFLGVYGAQSGFESRTSSFVTPLKPVVPVAPVVPVVPVVRAEARSDDRVQPVIARPSTTNVNTPSGLRSAMVTPPGRGGFRDGGWRNSTATADGR